MSAKKINVIEKCHPITPNFRQVDVFGGYRARTGPGGAHENELRDHARGRIYRVVWDKAQKPALTWCMRSGRCRVLASWTTGRTKRRCWRRIPCCAGTRRALPADDRGKMLFFSAGVVSINILHVARGDGYFDDVKLCELI